MAFICQLGPRTAALRRSSTLCSQLVGFSMTGDTCLCTEKSCLPSRPSHGEIVPPNMSQWVSARFQTKHSHCAWFSYREGAWLRQVPLSVTIIIGPICHCSPGMQLASSVHRWDESIPATSQTFEGKALVTREGRAPRCLLTYPHRQPFSDSTPSDSLPMIRVDWTWDSEPCYSTCAKRCCFAVGWCHSEGNWEELVVG